MRNLLLVVLILMFSQQAFPGHGIIPEPVRYEATQHAFKLDGPLRIHVDEHNKNLQNLALQFQQHLHKLGIESQIQRADTPREDQQGLVLRVDESSTTELGGEGYQLEVNNQSISISAAAPAGVFYGLQSLKQLLPPPLKNNSPVQETILLQGCRITDFPRFSWRGLMLDVSRHFFSVNDVKAYIDKMSEYKFNVFHWHLTDDEGWRIEIESLPELTRVGAWRVERSGRFGDHRARPEKGEEPSYGGFYTHSDIREVVQYAAERNIVIVPEIDMPGHSMAALAAYPELSVNNEAKFVNPGSKFAQWHADGTFEMEIENTLDPTDEAVYEFADKVFSEVAQLFPGEYIHMGGDEAYHGFWERDPGVRAFMKENGIENSHDLQSYFIGRIEQIINSKNKKMIGWDEIIEGDLSTRSAVMAWRGMKGGIEAAQKGHKVVMSPTTYAYLDYTQGDHSVENPIYADLSLETAYQFDPLPDAVDPDLILGGQGNLWTEAVPNLPFAFYMTYPRAFALAEALWSQVEDRDWNLFISKAEDHISRFEMSGVNVSRAVFDPIVEVFHENGNLMCRLSNPVPGSEIYYTVDNTYPPITGTRYSRVFEVPEGKLNLRTQVYRDGLPLGRELVLDRTILEERAGKSTSQGDG